MSTERAEDTFRVREAFAEDHTLLQSVLDGSVGVSGARVYGMAADELLRHNRVYMAFLADRPMGCVMATLAEPMVLHCLHVVPEHRRKGYAGTLLSSAILDMDETRPVTFWTAVDPARRSGVERCLSLGFNHLTIDFAEISAPLSEMCVMIRPARETPDADEIKLAS